MKKFMTMVALGSALIVSGCATQTAILKPTQATVATTTESQSFFIGGIGQEKTIDASAACGSAQNVAKVQTTQTGKEVLLSAITFGIYSPRTAQVYCK